MSAISQHRLVARRGRQQRAHLEDHAELRLDPRVVVVLESLGGDDAGNRGLRQTLLRDAAGAEMAGGGGSSDC